METPWNGDNYRQSTYTWKIVTETQAILLPIQVAVCKCSAHTNAKDIVSKGNTFADKTAKEAAEQTTDVFTLEEDKQPLTATFRKDMPMHSSKTEKLTLKKHVKQKDGLYKTPTGKPVLPKKYV